MEETWWVEEKRCSLEEFIPLEVEARFLLPEEGRRRGILEAYCGS